MQIILMEKVANLGNLGDLLKVKDGYARNFLIPTGKAKRATPAALKEFEVKRVELENAARDKLAAAQAYAERLGGAVVRIARKAGVDGRLFGSVTNFDVADGLRALGFEIEKSAIRMPAGPLKVIGETPLEVVLHGDVMATITVAVVVEQPKL
ncbi:MAG TPA: 50S ribosomal protein L9 [Accumulibacter sp.]|uniref:Large ribosomal subunit protein bL9 n=2 Tax=Candidatus Accumulibacter TaxID=327159 RepID=A0A080MCG3_9PROT|nr:MULTISPECIES: 50S ribosomal protein L9 [Candidatus Accumulibacter]KFB74864.1 MAG: 50S ribosomal protein L9 [Candidatus Accumulibacter cognatus]TMQ74688.1 LSU ribosomal protein L9p [Candidatus Accumulibacter phosphatis]HNC21307.1 50S ribosomal protein L9 [Accumulibacter sp.]HNF92107.1 50S ribosomal protein L9 [Accumulibacter sp.]